MSSNGGDDMVRYLVMLALILMMCMGLCSQALKVDTPTFHGETWNCFTMPKVMDSE